MLKCLLRLFSQEMGVHILLVHFLLVTSWEWTVAQNFPPTPCPSVFQYNDWPTQTVGLLTATNPPSYGSMVIEVTLSVSAKVPEENSARVVPYYTGDSIARSMREGSPIYYVVYFPSGYPIPYVLRIEFNGDIICSGPPARGRIVTTLTMSHTFTSGSSYTDGNNNNRMQPLRRMRPQSFNMPNMLDFGSSNMFNSFGSNFNLLSDDYNPAPSYDNRPREQYDPSPRSNNRPREEYYPITRRRTTTGTTTQRTTVSMNDGFSFVSCGVPDTQETMGLINGGSVANREDWPWLVALYKRTGSSGNRRIDFQCGASLVSERLVITAAHCVTTSTGRELNPLQFLLMIGAYNIDEETDELALLRTPNRIVVRSDYNASTYANDLSVIVLTTVVTFSKYIRPVCLWDSSDDQNLIVKSKGTVVGWGRDELGASVTSEPKAIEVPIVSALDCRTSNEILYQAFTNTSLCAGARDNTGPCNGDSGGGLYLKRGNRWYLRGVVSSALKRAQDRYCNLTQYVLYTDVAKFGSWINSIF